MGNTQKRVLQPVESIASKGGGLEIFIAPLKQTTVTELKCVRCRNSRRMPELPTVGTPDSRWNSRPSRHLKTCRWPLAVHTGHVRYDHHCELSKSVKHEMSELSTIAETPDRQNFRLTSELPTNQPEINNIVIAGQIPDTSGIARPAKIN